MQLMKGKPTPDTVTVKDSMPEPNLCMLLLLYSLVVCVILTKIEDA